MKQKQLIRQKFRESVFKRDGYKCLFCDVHGEENLDAHHITDRSLMPNGGYVKENGISLCERHHMMAEKFHISDGSEWEKGMHPNDLYAMIGSSYELAIKLAGKE